MSAITCKPFLSARQMFAGFALCMAIQAAWPVEPPAARMAVYVSAHPDDWQLFAGDLAVSDILSARRVLFIYVTSGIGGETDAYWRARERGALASQYLAANTQPTTVPLAKAFQCSLHNVGPRSVYRCRFLNVVSYHLRLPNAKTNGSGYETTAMKTLHGLRSKQFSSLPPVDGSPPFKSWGELDATIRSIVEEEIHTAGIARVSIFTHEPDLARNPGDHDDHIATGRLVTEAIAGTSFELVYFTGYDIAHRAPNLSISATAVKGALFRAYDLEMAATDIKWYSGTGYMNFFNKTYTRRVTLHE